MGSLLFEIIINISLQYLHIMGASNSKVKKHVKYQKLSAPLLNQSEQSEVFDSRHEKKLALMEYEEETSVQMANGSQGSSIKAEYKQQNYSKKYSQPIKVQKEEKIQSEIETKWNECLGLVISKFEDKTLIATGILIGPNLVLTSARNLYDRQSESLAKNIKFHQKGKKSKIYEGDEIHYPSQYKKSLRQESLQHDFGVFQIKTNSPQPFLQTSSIDIYEIKGDNIDICGYNQENQETEFRLNYECLSYENNLVYMLLEGFVGHPGNPIIIKNRIVGIQSETKNEFSISNAVPFSPQKHKIIEGWKEAMLAKYNFLRKIEGQKTHRFKEETITLQELQKYRLGRQSQITSLTCDAVALTQKQVKIISSCVNLKQLSLWCNHLSPQLLTQLSYQKFHQLYKLNLGFNALGDESMLQITKFNNLRELSLQQNYITPAGAKLLTQNKYLNQSLSVLRLWGNLLGNEGMQHLRQFQNLTQLYLFSNHISCEGVKSLSKGLFPKLTVLDLMYNEIGPEGARALKNFKKLTQLYLFSNRIGSEGMIYLSEAKENLISILDVGQNQIDNVGFFAMQKFPKLSKLYISHNRITEDGLVNVVYFLPHMVFLTEISLKQNLFSREEGITFKKVLSRQQISIKL